MQYLCVTKAPGVWPTLLRQTDIAGFTTCIIFIITTKILTCSAFLWSDGSAAHKVHKAKTKISLQLVIFTTDLVVFVFTAAISVPPKGGREFMSRISGISVWSVYILFFLPSPVAYSVLSMLLAHSPDFFFPNPPFSERQALLCRSCFLFFWADRRWVF